MTRNHEGSSFDQERAEALGEGFDDYRVHLGHWPELAQAFRDAYQPVWVRAMSRVLLVCGPQGSGKSLFCRRLAQDHAATLKALERDGTVTPDLENNLWHLLVVDRKDNAAEVIAETTRQTEIRPIRERTGWLDDLTRWGQENKSKVRVLVFDNFHRERFLSERLGVSPSTRTCGAGRRAGSRASCRWSRRRWCRSRGASSSARCSCASPTTPP